MNPNTYAATAVRSCWACCTRCAISWAVIFEEMRPEPALITNPPSLKVDLQQLLSVMNARIEQLLDHDHCIGHYYLMDIKDLASLRSAFANKIIPLLREYFYGNPARVGMVLGTAFVKRNGIKTRFAPGWSSDDLDEKEVFTFADVSKLTEQDFQAIYAKDRPSV